MWLDPWKNIPYEFVLASSAVCLIRFIWMVWEMGGKWQYNCCFVGCCFQELFCVARSILVQIPSTFFFLCVLTASMWCIHTVVLTQPLLGRDPVLFYRIDQTSIPIILTSTITYLIRWRLEYNDFIPSRRIQAPKKVWPRYDTKLSLMVRLQLCRSGERRELFHCHDSQIHSKMER